MRRRQLGRSHLACDCCHVNSNTRAVKKQLRLRESINVKFTQLRNVIVTVTPMFKKYVGQKT